MRLRQPDEPNDIDARVRTGAAISEVVAANIRRLRYQRQWSQKHMATILVGAGMPMGSTALAKMETGGRKYITVDELAVFAKVFGVDPWSLTGEVECPQCQGSPPIGYACLSCGISGEPE